MICASMHETEAFSAAKSVSGELQGAPSIQEVVMQMRKSCSQIEMQR